MPASLTDWPAPPLLLRLPPEYQLAHHSSEQLPTPIPGTSAREEFWRWEAAGERVLHLFCWQPMAPRPGGPVRAVAEWPATVAGQATQVLEADLFMGYAQRVLVTHLVLPGAQLMLYAKGLNQPEFLALLAAIELRPA